MEGEDSTDCRPSEHDQINMIMCSLQPRFARHLMGFPHIDFRSLVQALYGIEEGIARGLWADSSPPDSKGKKLGSSPKIIRYWCYWYIEPHVFMLATDS